MERNDVNVDFNRILSFARTNAWSVVLRGGVSLAAAVGLLALFYAFAPRAESYRLDVHVTLESSGGTGLHYPNGRSFSSQDLISTPVAHRVWKKFGLADQGIDFDVFRKWFALVGCDKERAKLDAEYRAKMGKRNISVTELSALQKEYEAKIDALSPNVFTVSMKPDVMLNRAKAAEILGSVPEAWYDEYVLLNAPQMPPVMRPEVIRDHWKSLQGQKGRSLELVDTLKRFLTELRNTCEYVRTKVLLGRNAVIDGTDLGSHEALLSIYADELLRLKNLVLEKGDTNDLGGYVKSRLDDMACEEIETQKSVDALVQTLDILNEKYANPRSAGGDMGTVSHANTAFPVAMQADSGFLGDFAQMVRKAAKQDSVRKYADLLTEERRKQAALASRKLYYDQIQKYVAAAGSRPASPAMEEARATVENVVSNILAEGEKLLSFRDRALAVYRTSDQFYALPAPARYGRTFTFSLARIALGILALWGLYNLLYLVLAWNRRTE